MNKTDPAGPLDRSEESPRPVVPENFVRRSGIVFAMGVPILIVLMVFVDRRFAIACHDMGHNLTYRFFDHVETLGSGTWYIAPFAVLALVLYFAGSSWWRASLYISVSAAVSGIIVDLLKVFFGRNRPVRFFDDGEYGFTFFKLKASMMSFPSGHTTTAFAVAVALGVLFPRFRVYLWVLAALAGLGRAVTTAHYPSDVLAGAWLGSVTSLALARYVFYRPGPNAA